MVIHKNISAQQEEISPVGKVYVLMAEDDNALRLVIKHVLDINDSFEILEAGNGEEAIRLYQLYKPSLVLMDAIMPGMDGFEACRLIRDIDSDHKATILMMTSLDDETTIERAFESGADDFIAKPLHLAVLKHRISHMVDKVINDRKLEDIERQFCNINKMEALGRLVTGISHNFNNLLVTITGYTELLDDAIQNKDERVTRYLAELYRAGGRAQEVISDLQNYSSSSISDMTYIEPSLVLNDSYKILKASISSRYNIRLHMEEQLPLLYADINSLKQCLINLAINASEAMDRGGDIGLSLGKKSITGHEIFCVSCDQLIPAGEYLCFTVEDEGGGVDPSYSDRIFEPFYSHKFTSNHPGMGLSIVHAVTHTMNGHIQMHNTEMGFSISLLIPVKAQADPANKAI